MDGKKKSEGGEPLTIEQCYDLIASEYGYTPEQFYALTRKQIMGMVDVIYERKYGKQKAETGKVEVSLTPEQEKKIQDRINSRLMNGKVPL